MNPLELVDDLYEEFASGLGGDLAAHARDLPRALRLAPIADAPWSRVFAHEITLAAPALFADAFPGLALLTVRAAVRAHMLSVIDAFGTDRVEDGQVRLTGRVAARPRGDPRRARRDAPAAGVGPVPNVKSPSDLAGLGALVVLRSNGFFDSLVDQKKPGLDVLKQLGL